MDLVFLKLAALACRRLEVGRMVEQTLQHLRNNLASTWVHLPDPLATPEIPRIVPSFFGFNCALNLPLYIMHVFYGDMVHQGYVFL